MNKEKIILGGGGRTGGAFVQEDGRVAGLGEGLEVAVGQPGQQEPRQGYSDHEGRRPKKAAARVRLHRLSSDCCSPCRLHLRSMQNKKQKNNRKKSRENKMNVKEMKRNLFSSKQE
jgi:hypothetical protein